MNSIKYIICALIASITSTGYAQPNPPTLSSFTTGSRLDLAWSEISGATGYTLGCRNTAILVIF